MAKQKGREKKEVIWGWVVWFVWSFLLGFLFLLLLFLFLSQKAAGKSRGVYKEDERNYSVSCKVGVNKNPYQNTERNREPGKRLTRRGKHCECREHPHGSHSKCQDSLRASTAHLTPVTMGLW